MNKQQTLIRFAFHINALRKLKGLSIRQLAAASGLEFSHVQRIEKGKVNFAFTTLLALAQGLEISVENLLKGYEPTK